MLRRNLTWTCLVLAMAACGGGDDPFDSNNDPTAVIVADATGERGVAIQLDGSGSSDPDGQELTYAWTFSSRPAASSATIHDDNLETASFVPDAIGSFVVQLTVSDGDADDATTTTIVIDVQSLGSISVDSVIPNTNSPAGEADYRVEAFDVLSFSADVVIEPGVTIRMGESSSITVAEGGSLSAVGTAALPIRFLGEQDAPGFWDNIDILSSNPLNELTHVEVANAGGNNFGAIYLTGRLILTNSTIRDSGDYGLETTSSAVLPGFADNAFAGSPQGVMYLSSQLLGSLDGDTDYLGSGDGVVHVYGTDVTGTQIWPAINAPFRIEEFDIVNIRGDVFVEAGALFVMGESSGVQIATAGSFSAVGTAVDSIRFVGADDIAGYWNNLDFDSNNSANRLSYVEVANGGGNSFGSLYIGGTVNIDNTLIRDSGDFGVEVLSSGLLPGFGSNHFARNQLGPLTIPASRMGSLDSETVYADANGIDYIDVFGSNVEFLQTWPATDAPFFLRSAHIIGVYADITVEPGFRLLFGASSGLLLGAGGFMTAIGTAGDSIYFVGEEPTQGYWNNFEVESDAANTMAYVQIAHGGGNNFGMVYVGGSLNISNSYIHHSADFGVEVTTQGDYVDNGSVTYSDNALGDVDQP